MRSHLLKHQLNQLPSKNKHLSSTPSDRGHFGESSSIRPHVCPTAWHGPNIHSTTFGPHFDSTTHVGSSPPVGLNASTPSLEAHGIAPLEALDPSPPGISPQSIQGFNPRTHETFASEDDQNVWDVQSISEKLFWQLMDMGKSLKF